MARRAIVLLAVPVAVLGLVVGAWALFGRGSAGEVLARVRLGDQSVAGFDADELATVVDALADAYDDADVVVHTSADDLEVTTAELDLAVDRAATVAATLDEGRDGNVVGRAVGWAWSLVRPRHAPVVVTMDEVALAGIVEERDPTDREPAIEPTLHFEDGEFVVSPGRDGHGLDPNEVAEAIIDAAESGDVPIEVNADAIILEPRFDRSDAEALAVRARELTTGPLQVRADEATTTIPADTLRSWMTSTPTLAGLQLDLDDDAVIRELIVLLGEVGTDAVDATVRIEAGRPVVVPGMDGTRCCDASAPAAMLEALANDRPFVSIPLAARPPNRSSDDVDELGIVEEIGGFTTRYPAGQSRVVNIHRIAELIDGVLLEPGDSFSINEFVGERTREKGFVAGGVIENGVFAESVGGGISQFATTLFNAAFFGGLDIEEYQSHSIYISRYPYGREATLSYPNPDLVIENSTPHGVLIDTSVTSSSVTVTLWSTRYVTGEQTAQTQSPVGLCTRVKTERTRTYVDGRIEVDNVFATYRPGEGVPC